MDDNLEKAPELPYFDGDFWPNALEDSIKELDQEEEERKASALAEAAGDMVCITNNFTLSLHENGWIWNRILNFVAGYSKKR